MHTGGFAIPLFGELSSPFIARGEPAISSFQRADVAPANIKAIPSENDIAVGDPYPYGFETINGVLAIGPYDEISSLVRAQFPLFNELPFTQQGMAEFLGDEALYDDATARCVALMDQIRPGAGEAYRKNNLFRPFRPAANK